MHHVGVGEQGPEVGAGNDGVAAALRPAHAQVQRQHRRPHLQATSSGRDGWLVTTAYSQGRAWSHSSAFLVCLPDLCYITGLTDIEADRGQTDTSLYH